ncbi:MAG: signal peptidase I [Gammaproteobacteria bacterium]|nr:signal peptidase I [Gammaproteobacteria bacterium]
MILDFSFYLFVAVAFTGTVWLIDVFFLKSRRNEVIQSSSQIHQGVEITRKAKEPVIVEYSKSFFPVLLIVFLLRGFIVEPFRIPSGSMLPSLYIGDFILVNKFAYGIRIPVLNKKIVELSEPERGDVVVFRYPRDPNLDYIKRIIGLPGDHIAYYNKVLYVNGKPIARDFAGQYKGPGQTFANEYIEKMDGVDHSILLLPARPNNLQGEYIVPEDSYFAMGDNRDNSNDSRVWGPVPEENLVGKAFMIWMHYSDEWHFERIGNVIK